MSSGNQRAARSDETSPVQRTDDQWCHPRDRFRRQDRESAAEKLGPAAPAVPVAVPPA